MIYNKNNFNAYKAQNKNKKYIYFIKYIFIDKRFFASYIIFKNKFEIKI